MIKTTKNNNQKSEDYIWYKNKMSRDAIQRQINSIKDSRSNTSQLKEWIPNPIQKIKYKGMK
jgi:hypothetical protein